MFSLYTTLTYFILNVTVQQSSHNYPMETSECLMFGETRACPSVFGKIGKSNPPFIVGLIICPLGKFSLIIFVVGLNCFRCSDTAM